MASTIKLMVVLVCAVLVCTAAGESEEGQTGRSRVSDDQLNIALVDHRYLKRQLTCVLGEVPCDQIGRRLKSLAPLVLRGSCPQCTTEETRQIKKVLSHIQRTYPKEWSRILQKYIGIS
ncbi:chemosensory protein 2 [Ptiloglossa arizonensis]|uniref:chemosensory protein 2 n=1 Tax=Ptiloglossa arizonensis TaxID=3350558 RepID=UPI003FA0669F